MFGWFWVKVKCKLIGKIIKEEKIKRKYFSKHGVNIGRNCAIFSDITTPESYLITIGDNVTVSNDVQFITHDNCIDRLMPEKCDVFGEIVIGDNCFIGAHSIVLPGVTLGEKTVVGVGSVVSKSFEGHVIIAGNPAKVIGNVNQYLDKYAELAFDENDYLIGKKEFIQQNPHKIIRNR